MARMVPVQTRSAPRDRFLCKRGIHYWYLFGMAPEFRKSFPEQSHIGRYCVYCLKLQYLSDDRRRWNDRVWGTLYAEVSE